MVAKNPGKIYSASSAFAVGQIKNKNGLKQFEFVLKIADTNFGKDVLWTIMSLSNTFKPFLYEVKF